MKMFGIGDGSKVKTLDQQMYPTMVQILTAVNSSAFLLGKSVIYIARELHSKREDVSALSTSAMKYLEHLSPRSTKF